LESGKIQLIKDVTNIKDSTIDLKIKWKEDSKDRKFSAHGIGLHVTEKDEKYLFAINHWEQNDTIEIFKHDELTNFLIHQDTLSDKLFISLNDVHPISPTACYATNDHGTKSEFNYLWDLLGIPLSNVVFHDGKKAKIAAKWFVYANGIAGYGNHIYVAETFPQKLHIYEINYADNTLKLKASKFVNTGVDNIVVDSFDHENINITVAGHPSLWKFAKYMLNSDQDKKLTAPSEVFSQKITKNGQFLGEPNKLYYYNGGKAIGNTVDTIYGSSTGVVVNGHLLIGTVNDSDILDCYSNSNITKDM